MKLGYLLVLVLCVPAIAQPVPTSQPVEADDEPIPEPKRVAVVGKLPTTLPVRVAQTGHLLVAPRINGQDVGWFILDTGAGMSCVDKSIVEKLKLPVAGEATAMGAGGKKATKLRTTSLLELGPLRLEDAPVVELDLAAIRMFVDPQLMGIIGYECFVPAIYEINVADARVTLHAREQFKLPGGEWSPIQLLGRRPYVSGSIEGLEPGPVLVDTGQTDAVMVPSNVVEKHKLLEGRKTRGSFMGGVGGLNSSVQGKLDRFVFADQFVTDVATNFSKSRKGAAAGDAHGCIANIGIPLLRRFDVFVDYAGQRIAFVPKK